ncbi:MAG: TIGR02099 family protein [Xanthomonadales bacterium]|nr:TIGR02099 family protein [Xanthomonadales bacterium]
MNPRWQRGLRRLRLAVLGVLAGGIILLGFLAGLTQLAMPWLSRHPQHVEHWLGERLGREVSIGRLDGHWVGGGPLLQLEDVRIGGPDGEAGLRVRQAQLAFDLSGPFRRHGAFSRFRISGLDLRLLHGAEGWTLQGLALGGEPGTFSMGALGALELTDVDLAIEDPAAALDVALGVPVLRVVNRGERLAIGARVRLAEPGSPLVDVAAELDPESRSGLLYAGARRLDLARLGSIPAPAGLRPLQGQGSVELWAHLREARITDVRARVDLGAATIRAAAPATAEAHFERLAFAARWQHRGDGWALDVADLVAGSADAAPARLAIARTGVGATPAWRAGARALPLQAAAGLAALPERLPPALRQWLAAAQPHGVVETGSFWWRGAEDYAVVGTLRGLRLAPVGAIPGIADLDLDVRGDAGALLLHLPAQATRVDYPHVFRTPLRFSRFGGDVAAWREDGAWRLASDRLAFEGEGYGGELRGGATFAAGELPFLELYAAVDHADVTAARLFWPVNVMPTAAVAWLDRGLAGGRVTGGRGAFRGHLADWPFENLGGRMIARAEVEGARLDFDPDWPAAEDIEAVALFVNESMHIEASAATTRGIAVGEASAVIENLGEPVLELAAAAQGGGTRLIDYLRATPIGARYQEHLKDVTVRGEGKVALAFSLPIDDPDALELEGSVELAGAELGQAAYGLQFTDARGSVRFSEDGVTADPLDVQFRDARARFTLAIGSTVADSANVVEASLKGRFPPAAVFADVPAVLPLLVDASGESDWTARVAVPAGAGGTAMLRLDSTLAGTAIALPAPLDKPAAASWPFHLDLPLPPPGKTFRATLADIATITGRVPSPLDAFAARIDFGNAPRVAPLPAEGVSIAGRVDALAASAWLDRAGGGNGEGEGAGILRRIELQAGDFRLASRHFADMRFSLEEQVDATRLAFDSAALKGTVDLPRARGAAVSAHFERFHWPEPPGTDQGGNALPDLAPAALPPLDIRIDDFRLGEARFGSATLQTHPTAGGMRVDTLRSHSPNIDMQATGDWLGSAGDNHSSFAVRLSAQNLGDMMAALGFPGLIDGGTTEARIDATWPGAPSTFALARLDGTLSIRIGEGRILDVEPGAGRILGLFSLAEIPRRLALDFSDLFKSGFAFNSIGGTFRLAGGNAYTDDLRIRGPAADIAISGRTGLRARDYDQRMDVAPRAGTALPVVGALAAGPVGAAAGLVAQGIFNKPLARAVERHYRVTGSWDKPEVVLERSGSEAPPRRRDPGKG